MPSDKATAIRRCWRRAAPTATIGTMIASEIGKANGKYWKGRRARQTPPSTVRSTSHSGRHLPATLQDSPMHTATTDARATDCRGEHDHHAVPGLASVANVANRGKRQWDGPEPENQRQEQRGERNPLPPGERELDAVRQPVGRLHQPAVEEHDPLGQAPVHAARGQGGVRGERGLEVRRPDGRLPQEIRGGPQELVAADGLGAAEEHVRRGLTRDLEHADADRRLADAEQGQDADGSDDHGAVEQQESIPARRCGRSSLTRQVWSARVLASRVLRRMCCFLAAPQACRGCGRRAAERHGSGVSPGTR